MFCGKPTNNPKFCNRSCSASYNNVGVRRHGKAKNSTECIQCHEKLGVGSKYCSHKCQQAYQSDRFIESWLFGENCGGRESGTGTSHIIRNFLLDMYENKCARCGWGEVNLTTGKIPLELEHIDGNHKNNNFFNLIILCPNCHSLTPTYKALNRGNGRKWRQLV